MDRRQYLHALAGVATLGSAGCAGLGDGGGEATPTETPSDTATGPPNDTPTATSPGTPTGTAGTQQVATHYKFGGTVEGWQGREPQGIAGKQNPTLTLEAGTKYRVTWENLDGAAHNFTIRDSDGNRLASTKTASKQGTTLSLTFTASEHMAHYFCTKHPDTMVGTINSTGG